jgi:hypothetical protein
MDYLMNAVVLDPLVSSAMVVTKVTRMPTKPSLVEEPVELDGGALVEEDDRSGVGPYRQWNPSAVACYLRQAQCEGCFYKAFFDARNYECHMAGAVQHLLKRVGPPDARRIARCV